MSKKNELLLELQNIEAQIQELEQGSNEEENELEELLQEELLLLAESNLYHFIVSSWQFIARGEFKENWYVDAICEHLMALRTREIEKLAIAIAPRHGKPVAKTSLVLMANGTYKAIGDIKPGEYVINSKGQPDKVIAWLDQGLLESKQITTKTSRQVVAANDHPFLTTTGWLKVEDLQVGMYLTNVGLPQILSSCNRSIDEFALAGYFIGDGYCTQGNANITNNDPATLDHIFAVVNRLGFDPRKERATTKTYRVNIKGGIRDWLKEVGIAGKNSYTKTVPDWVFQGSSEQIASFVAAYFACDGYVSKKSRNRESFSVRINSVSKTLLSQVQQLLLRLGIQSFLRTKRTTYHGNPYISYQLGTSTANDVYWFRELVAKPHLHSKKLLLLSQSNYFPNRVFNTLKEDCIREIVDVGLVDCCCIQVENDHTYTVNDLICHNSSICSVAFPVWCWIQDATHTFITASYGESLVVRDAVASRRLINTNWFQQRWGRLFKLRSDTNQKSRYENDKGGFRLATSVEGKGTGEGCRTLVIDDPHKALEAHSRASKDKVGSWYFDTMSSRWETPETFTQLIVHQRLAEDDLIGRILTEDSGWEYFALPVEYDPEHKYFTSLGFSDPRRGEGELLAPNIMSEEVVAKEKRKGEWRWASQFQQQPVPKGGGYVKSEQINEYSEAGLPDYFEILVASWDLANSNTGDFCVGTVWGKKGSRRYLVDCIRKKLTFPQQIEAILSFKTKYPDIRAVLIEKKSNGQAAIDTLQRHVSGIIAMEPKDYGGDKESRFIACTPEFEAGNVYFPAPSNKGKSWVRECKAELLMFPKGKHDDFVDSTSYALLYLAKYGQTLKQYNTIDVNATNVESPVELFDVKLIATNGSYYKSLF